MASHRTPTSFSISSRFLFLCLLIFSRTVYADDAPFRHAANWGGTGLMEIPTARVMDDGVARMGYAEARPFKWHTLAMGVFPGLEFDFRLTEFTNTKSNLGDAYGNNKDKAFDVKYQIFPESRGFPAMAMGLHDFHGTQRFEAAYVAMSRQIFPFDFTIGHGTKRLDGFFGGIEWAVNDHVHVMAEYNPINYKKDMPISADGRMAVPEGAVTPFNFGIRFMPLSWMDMDITYQRGDKLGFAARVSTDVGKELMPKKPDPMFWGTYDSEKRKKGPGPEQTRAWLEHIRDEIEAMGLVDVEVAAEGATLTVYCQNTKYLSNRKAVGRVYRVMLFSSPETMENLVVVLKKRNLPILSISIKRNRFKEFVFGEIDEEILGRSIEVQSYQAPAKRKPAAVAIPFEKQAPAERPVIGIKKEPVKSAASTSMVGIETGPMQDLKKAPTGAVPDQILVGSEKTVSLDWGIKPDLNLYLNDPSGFFKCRVGASPYASINLWKGGMASGKFFIPVYSNIESSNENVPDAVKSDSWKYLGADLILERLLFDQVYALPAKTFAKASFGYFETMYAGVAGELLKFIGNGNLAVGVMYDYAIKRKPESVFTLLDFKRHTLLGNIYYDLKPLELKLHAQYGKYLAKDIGWRFSVTRSYDNGVDIGCWYSFTDTDDLTSYNKDYNDKGVFIAIPVNVFSPVEKNTKYTYAISPWTRDVAATMYHYQDLHGMASDLMPGDFNENMRQIAE